MLFDKTYFYLWLLRSALLQFIILFEPQWCGYFETIDFGFME